jgi:transposase-like protein
VKGVWKYLYRAVDKADATVNFLLTAKRDRKAASRFLRKAIEHNGTPKEITIDKSCANTAAIECRNEGRDARIEIRRIKYLNNIVEQDRRAIKRLTRSMLGFKSFWSAAATLLSVKLMHMVRGHIHCNITSYAARRVLVERYESDKLITHENGGYRA